MLWYAIVVSALMGVAVFGLWGVLLLASRSVPELTAGQVSIRFHIAAELSTAAP